MMHNDSPQSAENEANLFREEPTKARLQRRLYSEPYQGQPETRMIAASLVSVTVISLALFVSFTPYTKTTTVLGQVSGRGGITRIKAHQPGIVVAAYVKEGERVRAGQVLFKTSSDRAADEDHTPVQQPALGDFARVTAQSGVTVKVVLPLKKQKLYQWMIEPLLLAKGRQHAHGQF